MSHRRKGYDHCLYCSSARIVAKGLCNLHYKRWQNRTPMEDVQQYGSKSKVGVVVNHLTLLAKDGDIFTCKCRCGNIVQRKRKDFYGGSSCGCVFRSVLIKRNKAMAKHGQASHEVDGKSSEYSAWTGMKCRCYNPKDRCYKNYGGRGIRVCVEWLNSFEQFFHDMGKKPSPKHSLDRVDVNGDYKPDNCRWATSKEQANNRRVIHKLQAELDAAKALLAQYKTLYGELNAA